MFIFNNKLLLLRIKKRIPKEFKKLFLLIYFLILVLGVILTLAYAFFHNLTVCSSLFGENFCTPMGLFLILLASLPGYIIAGNILKFLPDLPWVISLMLVIAVSCAFYFLVGSFIDGLRKKKITIPEVNKIIIILSLFLLLLLLMSLLK